MKPEITTLVAIPTPPGLYHFRFITFGIKIDQPVLTWIISRFLQEVPKVHHYLDGVPIVTNEWECHVETTKILWQGAPCGTDHKAKESEIGFCKKKTFRGYKVGKTVLAPFTKSPQEVQSAKLPAIIEEVWCFSGLTGFHRAFLPNSTSIS